MLDELCGATGWSRAYAPRALAAVLARKGPAGALGRKPRARGYSYDALKVLIEVWTLAGEPCGKYSAVIMADMLAALEAHGELGKGAGRLTVACQRDGTTSLPRAWDHLEVRFPPDRRGIDNEDRDAREAEEVRPGVP